MEKFVGCGLHRHIHRLDCDDRAVRFANDAMNDAAAKDPSDDRLRRRSEDDEVVTHGAGGLQYLRRGITYSDFKVNLAPFPSRPGNTVGQLLPSGPGDSLGF